MFKKLRKNEKGFTLAELLIVVAIIGVLVAISIPIFTAQLEKSRDAVTMANVRAAYAEASAAKLTASNGGTGVTYNATDGTVTVTDVVVKGQDGDGTAFKGTQLPFTVDDALAAALDKGSSVNVKFSWTTAGACSATKA